MMRILVAVLLILFGSPSLRAQQVDDWQASREAVDACANVPDPDKAIEICRGLLKPGQTPWVAAEAYRYIGMAHYRKGQFVEAIDSEGVAIAMRQELRTIGGMGTNLAYMWRGLALIHTGKAQAALDHFDACLAGFSSHYSPCGYGRALSLEAMGKLDWAIGAYELALGQYDQSYSSFGQLREVPDEINVSKPAIEKRLAELKAKVAAAPAASATPGPAATLTALLYSGRSSEAVAQLSNYVGAHPADQEGQFALGAARFLSAVERLGQSLYRYGLAGPGAGMTGEEFDLPFLRFPVPTNPHPEPLTFGKFRAVLATFANDLKDVDVPLAKVDDPNVALPINIGLVRFDIDANGDAAPEESLWRLFASVSSQPVDEKTSQQFLIRFDAGDAAWLRGYSHLLQAMADFLLAYDWHEGFDRTFQRFFPNSALPYAALDDLIKSQSALWDEYRRCRDESQRPYECYDKAPKEYTEDGQHTGLVDPFWVGATDLVAFVHLMHWPVLEPKRMTDALDHLQAMIAMSRLSWKQILAETDDDHEWIPNPSQVGALPGMRVTKEILDSWQAFLDQFEGLLEGKILLAHWRFSKGINLRRVFLEPSVFDPILWYQGSAALPYLEEGPLADFNTWQRMTQVFEGNFFSYALWLN